MTEMKNFIRSILFLSAVLASITRAEEVVYARVGDNVTLKPLGGKDLRNHYLHWLYGDENGLRLAWRNPLGGSDTTDKENWKTKLSDDSSLIINNIKQENFGTFVCKLAGEKNEKITYRLLRLDVVLNPASPLVPGELLTMASTAETPPSGQRPEIHWLNPQGEKFGTNQGSLHVRVTGKDHGQWTCVVTNKNKENKAKISVTVVDLSPAPSHPLYTSKSWPLTVPCSIRAHISWEQINAVGLQEVNWHFYPRPGSNHISGDPQRLFFLSGDPPTWTKVQGRDLTLTAPDPKKGSLSLTKKQVREDDSGDYICSMKVRNNVTLKRTVHVKVLQITSSAGTKFISGQQVNLSCSFGEPLPSDLTLKWVPPEQSSLKPDHHPAHLTIQEVGAEDGGRWRCELWRGNESLTSAVITLEIEPKLTVWRLVIICSVIVILILLLILVFIICRRRQRKTSHHRHRLCKCKTPKPKGFYRT